MQRTVQQAQTSLPSADLHHLECVPTSGAPLLEKIPECGASEKRQLAVKIHEHREQQAQSALQQARSSCPKDKSSPAGRQTRAGHAQWILIVTERLLASRLRSALIMHLCQSILLAPPVEVADVM